MWAVSAWVLTRPVFRTLEGPSKPKRRPSTGRQANFLVRIGWNERTQQTTLKRKRAGEVLVPVWCRRYPALDLAAYAGPDVRFGSKADVTLLNFDVRFTPESGHCQHFYECTP
jgi:hypothetical protein